LALITIVLLMFHVVGTRRATRTGGMKLAAAVTGTTQTPWLGLTVQPVTELLRKTYNLPGDGAMVSDVFAGGPAQRAGLRQGDLLQKLNGETINQPADVLAALQEVEPGSSVKAVVWRQGQTARVKLTVAGKPVAPPAPPPILPEPEIEVEAAWLGLDLVPLTPAEAEDFGIAEDVHGMLVDAVAAGRGVDAGLAVGDVILAVNGKRTPTLDAFKLAAAEAQGALLDVLRGGRHVYISVPPPGTSAVERKQLAQQLGLRTVNWDPPLMPGYVPQMVTGVAQPVPGIPTAPGWLPTVAQTPPAPARNPRTGIPLWGEDLPDWQRLGGLPPIGVEDWRRYLAAPLVNGQRVPLAGEDWQRVPNPAAPQGGLPTWPEDWRRLAAQGLAGAQAVHGDRAPAGGR
jgi:hypothetical protein